MTEHHDNVQDIAAKLARRSRRDGVLLDDLASEAAAAAVEYDRLASRPDPDPDPGPRPDPDPGPRPEPEPEPPRPIPPRGYTIPAWAQRPETPERPSGHRLRVRGGEAITPAIRSYYKANAVGADEWLHVVVEGAQHGELVLGSKYQAHNDGRPLNVYVEAFDGPGSAMIDGTRLASYAGTRVENLVMDGLDIRKAPGAKSPWWDDSTNGRVWLLNLRPMQNVSEALAGSNYHGGKWGYKPSDGTDFLFVQGTRHGRDPELGRNTRWFEHPIYVTGDGETWLLDNDFMGGNRTSIHMNTPRAGYWAQRVRNPCVIMNNNCEVGMEWGHDDGGSCITVWESRDKCLVAENAILSRYGGIAIAHQPTDAEQYSQYPTPHNFALPSGHVHQEPLVYGNRIDTRTGTRGCMSVSSAQRAEVVGNVIQHHDNMHLIIDTKFSVERGAPPCGRVIYDMDDDNVWHWDGSSYAPVVVR
jgi:hypothetical protein